METKMYPKKAMAVISTSTILYCAKCKQPSTIREKLYKEADADVFYHQGCVSDDTEKPTETKIVDLQLTDDLNVKSEGR